MTVQNFIKNITSKNIKLSQTIIKDIIDSTNVAMFQELCNNSSYIFPFIKERIIKDFVNLFNKTNLNAAFEFAKVYNLEFENIIINSWLKFACEDLTDNILELFENGTKEQKAYCAKYFSYIKDPIAIEYLYKEVKNDFEPLKINCAKALRGFGDKKIFNEMVEIVNNSQDEFEIFGAYQFINAYQDEAAIKFVSQNAHKSAFYCDIIANLKDFNSLSELQQVLSQDELTIIFSVLLMNYPENITLDTVIYYEIYDFINLLKSFNTQFARNILIIAKAKFSEFLSNDIYTFDLDKNTKEEIKNISDLLQTISLDISRIKDELLEYNCTPIRFQIALEAIKELKDTSYCEFLADLVNNQKLPLVLCANTAQILADLNNISLINKEKIQEIDNENVKALILSLV